MNLFYTTTVGYNVDQPNPDRSLGGYKSSTMVVNDDFGNMFDELSIMTLKSGRDEYRAIVLKNEFQTPADNIKVSIVRPADSVCTYKVGIGVLNGVNKYNQQYMENVSTGNNKPFHAQFVEMSEGVELDLGSLKPGEEIGLWVCRHVDKEEARKQCEEICEPDPSDPTGRMYRPVTHPKEESINLVISWN